MWVLFTNMVGNFRGSNSTIKDTAAVIREFDSSMKTVTVSKSTIEDAAAVVQELIID